MDSDRLDWQSIVSGHQGSDPASAAEVQAPASLAHTLSHCWLRPLIGVAVGLGIGVPLGTAWMHQNNTAITNTGTLSPTQAPTSAQVLPASGAELARASSTFTVTVKVLKKACSEHARCNVTFQVIPDYQNVPVISRRVLDVSYNVTNGEHGPQINTFVIPIGGQSFGDQAAVPDLSPGTVLRVQVTTTPGG